MADENIGAENGAPAAEPKNTESQEHMIPKARFDEVNKRAKDLAAQLAKLEKDQDTVREQQLAEQQQWKALAEERAKKLDELAPYKVQYEAVASTLEGLLAAQLEQLPDDARDMVESMPLDAQQKLDWLAKNGAKLMRPTAPNTDAGVRGDSAQKIRLTPGQEAAARMARMTNEQYIQALISSKPKE